MASIEIRRRRLSNGDERFDVRYRLAGRNSKRIYAGTFPTRRLAEIRVEKVREDLAADRVPRGHGGDDWRPLGEAMDRFIASRSDLSPRSLANMRQTRKVIEPLADRPIGAVTTDDIQLIVNKLHRYRNLRGSTLRTYFKPLGQVFDEARIYPNPMERVRYPRDEEEEGPPLDYVSWHKIRAALPERYVSLFDVMEQAGLRLREATALRPEDLDSVRCRIRVAKGRTKGRTNGARFVPIPQWLMTELMPLAIRASARKSTLFDIKPATAQSTFSRTLKRLGYVDEHDTALWSPHDLRHRFCSRLHLARIPARLAICVTGHSSPEIFLNTYAHVLMNEPSDDLEELAQRVFAELTTELKGVNQ